MIFFHNPIECAFPNTNNESRTQISKPVSEPPRKSRLAFNMYNLGEDLKTTGPKEKGDLPGCKVQLIT